MAVSNIEGAPGEAEPWQNILSKLDHLTALCSGIVEKQKGQDTILSRHHALLSEIHLKLLGPSAGQGVPDVEHPKWSRKSAGLERSSFAGGFMVGERYAADPVKFLFNCAADGDLELLHYLSFVRKVEINVEQENITTLSTAAGSGNLDIVQYLCKDAKAEAAFEKTALLAAAGSGHVDVLNYIWEWQEAHEDMNALLFELGEIALLGTAWSGHLEVARCLCDNKVDVVAERPDNAFDGTPPPRGGQDRSGELE